MIHIKKKSKTKLLIVLSAVMAVLIAAYVILLPLVYDSLKKRIPQIRYLNGEL